ncbi:MAG: hypothetical protein ACPHL6_06320, partial [Rubripirellula sp.]
YACSFVVEGQEIIVSCPIKTPCLTFKIPQRRGPVRSKSLGGDGSAEIQILSEVSRSSKLEAGSWMQVGNDLMICLDLDSDRLELEVGASL